MKVKNNTLIKYILVAFSSFILDITLFTLIHNFIIGNIVIATIIARIISSFYNFTLNKDKVFKSSNNKTKTLIEYYILVIIQMLISAFGVDKLCEFIKINPSIVKTVVDTIIFICNYLIQKFIIFKDKK